MTPDQSQVIVGGSFDTLNGTGAYGMGALDAASGATPPVGRAGAHPHGRPQRRHHEPEGRRHHDLRLRLRVRLRRELRGHLRRRPLGWGDQVGQRLPRRRVRRRAVRRCPLLGRPRARLHRHRRLARHQPAGALAEGAGRPAHPDRHDHRQGRLRLGLPWPAVRRCAAVVPRPRVRQLHARPPGSLGRRERRQLPRARWRVPHGQRRRPAGPDPVPQEVRRSALDEADLHHRDEPRRHLDRVRHGAHPLRLHLGPRRRAAHLRRLP